jgi:hypothetical protein
MRNIIRLNRNQARFMIYQPNRRLPVPYSEHMAIWDRIRNPLFRGLSVGIAGSAKIKTFRRIWRADEEVQD